MKNVTLFACLFVLTLGASAQNSSSGNPISVPPNAHNGVPPHVIGITRTHLPPEAQTVAADAKSATSGGQPVPPIAKKPPVALPVPPVARK